MPLWLNADVIEGPGGKKPLPGELFVRTCMEGCPAATLSLDPRLLVFEYSAGIVLRQTQVELVGKLVRCARNGRSICHQLIMGEGKTTVISPLLALLLADGAQLLMQIVPAPLLAFSLGVLRAVFGSGALRKS